METPSINLELCSARKNQTNNYHLQCPSKRKIGHYCGKHKNYLLKKLIPIDQQYDVIDKNKGDKNDIDKKENELIYDNISCTDDLNSLKHNIKTKMTKKKHSTLIIPYEYHKLSKLTLTLIDYLYDKELKYPVTFIKKSYKYYKLDKYNKREINLKLQNYNILDKSKYIKNKLQSFFELLLLAHINITSLILLQTNIKKYLKNKKIKIHGPALINRALCNNSTDFYSFDNIAEINNKYFFSYKDNDGFIYGFHIESFINLLSNQINATNPYNRVIISKNIKNAAIRIWTELNNKKDMPNYVNINSSTNIKDKVRNKCLLVFQKMDFFGYQTKIDWILNLTVNKVRHLYRSLKNYWEYKAQLTPAVKLQIYPEGNPFLGINTNRIHNINRFIVIDTVLDLMNLLISNGITDDDKNQGCILLLFAINDINSECGQCNPWLI
jgi:hypothetical protein